MIAWKLHRCHLVSLTVTGLITTLLTLVPLTLVGCSGGQQTDQLDEASSPNASASEEPATRDPSATDSAGAIPQPPSNRQSSSGSSATDRAGTSIGQDASSMNQQGSSSGALPQVTVPSITSPDGQSVDSRIQQRRLRPDLSPSALVEFLAGADQDLQLIVTGRSKITDPQKARDTLVHIVKMKREASRRLAEHPDSDAEQQSEGRRGELQALSHLAALGDLQAAGELETLATKNLISDDEKLVADSRLVLIGFAIEALQNGDDAAAEKIIQYIDQIASSDAPPDVPAMMVMGQARQVLQAYEHDDKARYVRDKIIELFADSQNPEIAQMAAALAGSVRFDEIEQLRSAVIDGQDLDPERWRQAGQTLLKESPDLQTVRYLAGTAVEFESVGRNDLSQAIYELLQTQFPDPSTATGYETQLAVTASRARQSLIGNPIDLQLPGLDGKPLNLEPLRGKVILMPFWASGFPESLQVIDQLKSIQRSMPDQVAIVGVNLDVEGVDAEKFALANELDFPSFRAPSSPTAEVANEVAQRFGMVSMPFTVVVGPDGRVAAIDFTGRDLETTVRKLFASSDQ